MNRFARPLVVASLVVASLATASSLVAQNAPNAPNQQAAPVQAAPKPAAAKPVVYDEKADAKVDVANALARAKKENRRVLIQWGANWCGWCVLLHGTMATNAEVRKKLSYEYDYVLVDVGRFDKNQELVKQYGAQIKGIPYLTLLDADGKVLANQDTERFELADKTKPGHDPKLLVDFLTEHQAPYVNADEVQAAALATAKGENKRVFLHFGAPWCGWCHKLEDWMSVPAVAALLSKEFVDLKIDTDRMLGGEVALKNARKQAGLTEDGGGIPWFLFLAADGKALATSEGPQGNIGCPYKDDEIAWFVTMLEKARVNLTPADVEALRSSLVEMRVADEKRKAQREVHQ